MTYEPSKEAIEPSDKAVMEASVKAYNGRPIPGMRDALAAAYAIDGVAAKQRGGEAERFILASKMIERLAKDCHEQAPSTFRDGMNFALGVIKGEFVAAAIRARAEAIRKDKQP